MKSLVGLSVMTLIAVAVFGCAGSGPGLNELEQQGHEIRQYEIFGMDCPGCHAGLQNLVNQIEGVKTSRANWEEKELIVVIEKGASVTDEAIYEAVKEANFTPGKRVK